MERQEGYYWVNNGYRFIVAEYKHSETWGGYWMVGGEENESHDGDFEFINENRIKAPGELPD